MFIVRYPISDVTESWVPLVATGGTVVTTSIGGFNHAIHTFASGTQTFQVFDTGTSGTVDWLAIAGGGGGGGNRGGGNRGGGRSNNRSRR